MAARKIRASGVERACSSGCPLVACFPVDFGRCLEEDRDGASDHLCHGRMLVVSHFADSSSQVFGQLDLGSYHRRTSPPVVWCRRLVCCTMITLHAAYDSTCKSARRRVRERIKLSSSRCSHAPHVDRQRTAVAAEVKYLLLPAPVLVPVDHDQAPGLRRAAATPRPGCRPPSRTAAATAPASPAPPTRVRAAAPRRRSGWPPAAARRPAPAAPTSCRSGAAHGARSTSCRAPGRARRRGRSSTAARSVMIGRIDRTRGVERTHRFDPCSAAAGLPGATVRSVSQAPDAP